MQIKSSDAMTDILSKNEEMNNQVNEIRLKIEVLQAQIFQLPELLTSTVKAELLKRKENSSLSRRRRRSKTSWPPSRKSSLRKSGSALSKESSPPDSRESQDTEASPFA